MIKALFIVGFIFIYSSNVFANCGKVRIGDFDWDSANVHTAVVAYILEKNFGCEVEIIKGSTNPITSKLIDNKIDLILENWEDNLTTLLQPQLDNKNLTHLGVNNISDSCGII